MNNCKYCKDKNVFNILSLNCCGIKSKLNYPEFVEFISEFDILCLLETKTDDCAEINIPGYSVQMKNRKLFSNRKSGGIILAYGQ